MTWARDTAEEAFLARSLEALVSLGYPVIAAALTNTRSFSTILTRLGIRVAAPSAPNLVARVQAAVAATDACPARYILYTEPDKEPFFRTALPQFLDHPPWQKDVGIVLAARTEESLPICRARQNSGQRTRSAPELHRARRRMARPAGLDLRPPA